MKPCKSLFVWLTLTTVVFFRFSTAQGQVADLTVVKSNDAGGAILLGNNWTWKVSIRNTGTGPAVFTDGQVILIDQLHDTNISFGATSLSNVTNITNQGNISAVIENNVLTVTASGGSVTIGATPGQFDVDFTATPSAPGTFNNPRDGGSCTVDPNTLITESNESNNTPTTDHVTVTAPDLTVTKLNNKSGTIQMGDNWIWTVRCQNTGTADATFTNGQTIVSDNLPNTNIIYSALNAASNVDKVTNSANINATIIGNELTISASGASVTLGASGGTFDITFTATPSAEGSFTNPRAGGNCIVDPNTLITESDEFNNTGSNTVTVIDPEIDVQRPSGTSIPDGNTDNLGNVKSGRIDLTYTIDNSASSSPLQVTGVTPTYDTNTSNFNVLTALPLNVPAGNSSSFAVSFDIDAMGAFILDMDIANNDADENPYDVRISGARINNAPTITDIPNQITDEDVPTPPIAFSIGDADVAPDQLGCYGRSQNQALVPDDNIVIQGLYEDKTVSITPAPNAYGSTLISIYVSDGIENTVETFWLTVNPVNDPPVILTDLPDQTGPEDMALPPLNFTVEDIDNPIGDINLSGSSSNPDLVPPANITFTGLESAMKGDETIKVTGAGTVQVTPAPDQFGTATITVTANDGSDDGTATFDITITPVNDAPVVDGIPDVELVEDEPDSLDLDDYAMDVDNDDAELTWTVVDLDTVTTITKNALLVTLAADVAVTIDPTTHVALFTLSANYNGPGGTFAFTATDPGGLADSDTMGVTVTAVNDTPMVTLPDDVTFAEDDSAFLDLNDYVTEVDGETAQLTWTVFDLDTATAAAATAKALATPEIAVTIDPATNVATFVSAANFFGDGGDFRFTATDPGGLAGQDVVTVTVTPVNDPPRFIGPLPPITLVQGQFYGFPIVLLYPLVEDLDNPDPTLIWSVEAHAHLNPTFGPDSVKITAPTDWEGTDTLTVTISDGDLTDTTQLVVTVTKAVDTTQPAAPTGLTAVVNADNVDLSWSPNIEPDIAAYIIYRSTDSTAFDATSLIGTVNHPTVAFNDNSITLGVTYYYMVSAVDSSGNESINNPVTRGIIVTGIEGGLQRPTEFSLGQNYPNPFNPTTTISYSLPTQTHVQIAIYNMAGQVMEMLVDQVMNTGLHTVQWDASSVPSGIYLYSIRTPEFSQVRKCMLMK